VDTTAELDAALDGTTVLLAGSDINDVVVTVVGGTLSTDVLTEIVAIGVSMVELSTSEELSGTGLED